MKTYEIKYEPVTVGEVVYPKYNIYYYDGDVVETKDVATSLSDCDSILKKGYVLKDDTKKFIYNNSGVLDIKTDFSEWINFNLTGYATINEFGDKSKITWKNSDNEIAIEEFPVYTRTKTGSGLLANFTLKRDLNIKFYRKDGTFETLTVHQKIYSFKERVDAEKKSRANIIDNTRDLTGKYIYQKNIVAGTPQLIESQLTATLTMFKSLAVELSVYREDREVTPLVNALTSFTPTDLIPQDVLDFIISKVNIVYY